MPSLQEVGPEREGRLLYKRGLKFRDGQTHEDSPCRPSYTGGSLHFEGLLFVQFNSYRFSWELILPRRERGLPLMRRMKQ